MSSNGTAGFLFLVIGTTMNSIRYCKMLKDKLKIYMAIHECNMFIQDGAPCHCSNLVSDFFKMKNWLDNSPDLNSIVRLVNTERQSGR